MQALNNALEELVIRVVGIVLRTLLAFLRAFFVVGDTVLNPPDLRPGFQDRPLYN